MRPFRFTVESHTGGMPVISAAHDCERMMGPAETRRMAKERR